MSKSSGQGTFRQAKLRAGIRNDSVPTLHSCATYLLEAGLISGLDAVSLI